MVEELFKTPGAGQDGGDFRVRVRRRRGSAHGNRSDGRDVEHAQGASEMTSLRHQTSECGCARSAPPWRSACHRARSRTPAGSPIRASASKPGLQRRRRGGAQHGAHRGSAEARRLLRSEERRPVKPIAAGTPPAPRRRTPPAATPRTRRARSIRVAGPSGSGFANSDLAFSGSTWSSGNFHGFNAYDIERPESPRCWRRSSARAARATSRSTATCCSCRSSRRAAASTAARRACRR